MRTNRIAVRIAPSRIAQGTDEERVQERLRGWAKFNEREDTDRILLEQGMRPDQDTIVGWAVSPDIEAPRNHHQLRESAGTG